MNQRNAEDFERLQQRVKDLELTLGQGDDNLAHTFKLTPVLNNLMGLLLSLPNATPEMIRQRLEIAHDAKVAVHRLRRHLKAFCEERKIEEIEIKSRRNLGYWFEDETKLLIRQLIAQKIRASTDASLPMVASESNELVEDAGPEDEQIAAAL